MTLTLAIIGHLVGDYLLQNDWMALNKKRHSFPCAIHCALWTAAVCFFTGWFSPLVVAVLFLTHFLQDRTTIIVWWMRLIGQHEFMRCDKIVTDHTPYIEADKVLSIAPGLGPWSIIVVDNVWHILTLWAVWRFVA